MGFTYRLIAKMRWFHKEVKLPTFLRLLVCLLPYTSAFDVTDFVIAYIDELQTGSLCHIFDTPNKFFDKEIMDGFKVNKNHT